MRSESDYEPLLVSSEQLLSRYWPVAAPMLDAYFQQHFNGEETLESVYAAITSGKMFMFVVKKDYVEGPDVALVLLLEAVQLPSSSGISVKHMVGRNLSLYAGKYWEYLCGWAYMVGARFIEADVTERLEPVVAKLGFSRTPSPIHVKMSLGDR